jgi:hypothetical protein
LGFVSSKGTGIKERKTNSISGQTKNHPLIRLHEELQQLRGNEGFFPNAKETA